MKLISNFSHRIDDILCTDHRIEVPLDWNRPDGPSINIKH